jgi:L-threonylcarbamoyladenylate synthase
MVGDLAAMKRLLVWCDVAEALALRFLPGPLTIVAPLAGKLPVGLTGGGATLGVRLSAHPVARLLCAAASGPLTATSANRSGGGEPYDPAAAFRSLAAGEELVEVVLDQGTLPASPVSTIVDLSGGIRIVRESAIALGTIRNCLTSAGLSRAVDLLTLANNASESAAKEER